MRLSPSTNLFGCSMIPLVPVQLQLLRQMRDSGKRRLRNSVVPVLLWDVCECSNDLICIFWSRFVICFPENLCSRNETLTTPLRFSEKSVIGIEAPSKEIKINFIFYCFVSQPDAIHCRFIRSEDNVIEIGLWWDLELIVIISFPDWHPSDDLYHSVR